MDITYDSVVNWFNSYFKAFNENAGPIETVPNMEKYFAPDMEFWSYNMAAGSVPMPSSREDLLRTMIHPGLHEELTPRYYVVDLQKMIVVVQFQLQFSDKPSGQVWPAKQASAHYHLTQNGEGDLQIKKIIYFTEATAPGETGNMRELWAKYRDEALAKQKKKKK